VKGCHYNSALPTEHRASINPSQNFDIFADPFHHWSPDKDAMERLIKSCNR
tara:strand:+ start:1707 stop:1859 length:153 start_codon:yes stop_codon:yes gene_type:complete